MEHAIRHLLRTTTPRSVLRLTRDTLALFCGITLIWENLVTFELSSGPSMYPTINPRGDYLLTLKTYRYGRGIQVGDVVRFHHPYFLGLQGGKRVLGLPGDFVCRDDALENGAGGRGEMIRVPEGHVYVVGDNLPWSRDSRTFGPIPMGLINGKIVARVRLPFDVQWVGNTLKPVEED
ncbi:putative mitochondrial inner membrane protease subunit 1 [Aspergillus lucknowensis]|uniref:Peptidase S24/S26A/S26B/S26C n=1 Tax=Aspergillus lucknowensis TaxID=176173 RepID=A0ABR4LKX6_9EURO